MKRALTLAVGMLIGQWLAVGSASPPGDLQALGMAAFDRRDYGEAVRIWSRAASTHPDDAMLHYLRGTALARLGQRQSASEAYQFALLLDPPLEVAKLARAGLSALNVAIASPVDDTVTVPLEWHRGVWAASVLINNRHVARFMIDSGASITVIAPSLAQTVGVAPAKVGGMELETIAGRTAAATARLASLRVAALEIPDALVVVHEPGAGLDGILGNDILSRYLVTLDAASGVLRLKRSPVAVAKE